MSRTEFPRAVSCSGLGRYCPVMIPSDEASGTCSKYCLTCSPFFDGDHDKTETHWNRAEIEALFNIHGIEGNTHRIVTSNIALWPDRQVPERYKRHLREPIQPAEGELPEGHPPEGHTQGPAGQRQQSESPQAPYRWPPPASRTADDGIAPLTLESVRFVHSAYSAVPPPGSASMPRDRSSFELYTDAPGAYRRRLSVVSPDEASRRYLPLDRGQRRGFTFVSETGLPDMGRREQSHSSDLRIADSAGLQRDAQGSNSDRGREQ